MVLTTILSMLRYVGEIDDRDFVDRLHSYFTVNMLIGAAILVSFKQFGGKPVECLVPDTFSGAWEQYAENYCWAQDTYYIPMKDVVAGIPRAEKLQRRISYYQWVPFFFLVEAACFRLPSLLWKYMSGYSGIKVQEIIKLSSDPNNIKPEIKKANIKSLTVHLQGALRFHRRLQKKQVTPHRYLRPFNVSYTSFFVTSVYLLTKFTYLFNVCIQLLLMNRFLETDRYKWYGLGAVIDLLNGTTWEQSGVFPRVSHCDLQVRVMGNIQSYTIQCVLVINIFNEKIFIFLWFWYLMLVVFTSGSLVYWLFVAFVPYVDRRFINRHLEMSEMPFDPADPESQEAVKKFIGSYLKNDGMFVIRMLTFHSGVIFGTDLVLALWKSYFGIESQLKRSNSFPEGVTLWPPPADRQIGRGECEYDKEENKLRFRKLGSTRNDDDVGQRSKKSKEELQRLLESTDMSVKSTKPKLPPKPYSPPIASEESGISEFSTPKTFTISPKSSPNRSTHENLPHSSSTDKPRFAL